MEIRVKRLAQRIERRRTVVGQHLDEPVIYELHALDEGIFLVLGLFKRKERPLPDFLVIDNPLTPEEADELRSVQKEFDVIDEEMWK